MMATYCRLQHNVLHLVLAILTYSECFSYVGTLLCWHAVITLDIHYIIGTFCSRITFSYVIVDCTHVQANLGHFTSFVLIIPSLPPHPNACPRLIQWLLWLQLCVCWHGGCADVGSMTLFSSLGCHALTTQLTSVVCICPMSYPDCNQLGTIYSTYLTAVCWAALGGHPMWSNTGKGHTLATSMVRLYSVVSLVHVQVWCLPSGASISYTTLGCGINYYVHILLLNFHRKLCW